MKRELETTVYLPISSIGLDRFEIPVKVLYLKHWDRVEKIIHAEAKLPEHKCFNGLLKRDDLKAMVTCQCNH